MSAGEGALLLLFPAGKRPDVATLRAALFGAHRVVVTGELGEGHISAPHGLELLRDGMTYDLLGAQPGPGIRFGFLPHRLGVPRELADQDCEAIVLRPGPHLAQGAATLPVMRTMIRLATMFVAHLPGLSALGWPSAGTLMGSDYFVTTMTAWLAGGSFPALGLTAFAASGEGGLRSEGLAFFTGQEVQLAADLCADPTEGARLGVRLINHLVGQGPVRRAEAILGTSGERLMLEPHAGTRTLRVRRG